MTSETQPQEAFEEFRKSFFYGKRSDLSFKFLADLTDEQAGRFLQDLFREIVQAVDTGNLKGLKSCLVKGQIQGYQSHLKPGFAYDEGPFSPLPKPLSRMKLGLLTSSGHFMAGQDPKPLGQENMTQAEAEARVMEFLKEPPTLSQIPFDASPEKIRVRHGGYDISGARKDHNVALPLSSMKQMLAKKRFAALTDHAWSFVGACSQKRLMTQTLPKWVKMIQGAGAHALVLVPV